MITRFIAYALVIVQLASLVRMQRDRIQPDVSPTERQFRVVYEWRTLDFAFRNEQERSAAIFRGEYIPRNVIFSDVQPYANRLYLVRLTIRRVTLKLEIKILHLRFSVYSANASWIARHAWLHCST